jgi:hypothetical protein
MVLIQDPFPSIFFKIRKKTNSDHNDAWFILKLKNNKKENIVYDTTFISSISLFFFKF